MTADVSPPLLLLAPMVGISHPAFRRLVAEFGGPDLYYSEMISAPRFVNTSPWEEVYSEPGPEPSRMVFQLTGPDARILCRAAQKLCRRECRGVDLNMGCAAPNIRSRDHGVAWMSRPEEAFAAVEALRRAVPGDRTVSAKIRLGERPDAEELARFCRGLESAGADYIVLHPRTRKQTLSRPADWNFVTAAAAAVGIPVYGNGDIDSPAAFERRSRYGASGFMIGRAAVGRPWLFAVLRGAAPRVDLLSTGLRFIDLVLELLPPEFRISRIRRFFFYYCDGLRFGHRLKWTIQNLDEPQRVREALENYFLRNGEEQILDNGPQV